MAIRNFDNSIVATKSVMIVARRDAPMQATLAANATAVASNISGAGPTRDYRFLASAARRYGSGVTIQSGDYIKWTGSVTSLNTAGDDATRQGPHLMTIDKTAQRTLANSFTIFKEFDYIAKGASASTLNPQGDKIATAPVEMIVMDRRAVTSLAYRNEMQTAVSNAAPATPTQRWF